MDTRPLSFVLTCQVSEPGRPGSPYTSASVQVWRAEQHVTTVKLLDLAPFNPPAEADLSTAEAYALAAVRVLERALTDVYLSALDTDTLHTKAAIDQAAKESDHA